MVGSGKKRRQKAPAGPWLFQMEGDANDQETEGSSPIDRWTIPKSWTWTTVAKVGEVKLGMARNPRNRAGINATKYLRAANITENGLDLNDVFEMDFDDEDREVFALRRGDIVLSEASGSPDQVGKPAIWHEELPICCFQNTVIRFRSMGVLCDFALILFQHYSANGLFANLVRGIGIGHLGSERFALLPFPLPPRKEQDRIAAEFADQSDSIKTAFGSLQRAKEKMELQRLAIVRKELGLEGRKSTEIPDGWSRVQLGDVCEIVNGRSFKTSEWAESGLPIIRIQNLRDKNAPFNYYDGEVEDRHTVNDGDLLFAWSGTPGTSFGAFLWQGPQGALNQHIFKISADQSRVSNEFLYYAINQNLLDYVAAAQGGGGLAHLTRGQFLNSHVTLAPLKEQDRIIKTIRTHLSTLDQQDAMIEQNLQRTRALRQALLIQAVEGKLVPQQEQNGSSTRHLAEIAETFVRYKKELHKRRKVLKGTDMVKKASRQASPKRDLHELLSELGPLSVQELFKKSGYREEKADEVEEFYRRLHQVMKLKSVVTVGGDSPENTTLKAVGI